MTKEFEQLQAYLEEFGPECLKAVLVAKEFGRRAVSMFRDRIIPMKYTVSCDLSTPKNFKELVEGIKLEKV